MRRFTSATLLKFLAASLVLLTAGLLIEGTVGSAMALVGLLGVLCFAYGAGFAVRTTD